MNPIIFLLIAVLGTIGFAILLVVGFNMWREERSKHSGQPGQAAETKAAESKAPASPLLGMLSGSGAGRAPTAGEHEVLRVLRDHLTGRLIVEIAGKRFTKISDLRDPNLAQGFLTTLHDLQQFAGGAPSAPTPTPAAPVEAPAALDRLKAEPSPPQAPAQPAQPAQPAPTPQPSAPKATTRASELPPLRMPTMNPFKQAQILRELKENPPPVLKSIPEQIDEFLQEKILGTPLIRRGLRVSAGPQGSVLFHLDGKTYPSVQEIPDPDVQTLLRTAIAEWEKSSQ